MDVSDSTPAIREFYLAQESAVSELRRQVSELMALESAALREEHREHRVLAAVHQICASILACEEAALERAEIVAILEPVRRIHARSPFVALSRSIAQQHQSTVPHQAARIVRTMLENPRQPMIASLARRSEGDPGARDVLSVARSLPRAAFDLVLAGGLFDSLDPRRAALLVKIAYGLLNPGGVFFFTNIGEGNPYRPLIEYFGDWKLIERSEEDVYAICDAAGIPRSNVSIRREETGLALLAEVAKLQ